MSKFRFEQRFVARLKRASHIGLRMIFPKQTKTKDRADFGITCLLLPRNLIPLAIRILKYRARSALLNRR